MKSQQLNLKRSTVERDGDHVVVGEPSPLAPDADLNPDSLYLKFKEPEGEDR
jgi:hypothetical protein